MKSKLSLFSLVMLIVASIDSIRTLPSTAFFGSSLVGYFLLAALLFLFPISFISAEFSSRDPTEGGVFHWMRRAFGEKMGVLAVWLQWINTMVWYPTMLLFIAGTVAHLVDPALSGNKIFLLFTVLATFWGLTLLNLRGIQVSARVNAFCGIVGTLLPMAVLICLGTWWLFSKGVSAISFSWETILPSGGDSASALITIMASLVGMELAGVYVKDIENPQKNFPKAIGYAVLILLSTLMLGALSVAVVIPHDEIRFVDGVMQTFTTFFHAFHIPFLVPVLAFLIILGSVGGSINWLLSPAQGLLQVAEFGFLPKVFQTQNKNGAPVSILIGQAVVVSVFCLAIQFMPSINSCYWFLMALSTSLYMLMYILLFVGALKLGRPLDADAYQIPRSFRTLSCIAGVIGCFLTLWIGFQPPAGVVIDHHWTYVGQIAMGFLALLAPVMLLWLYKRREYQKA